MASDTDAQDICVEGVALGSQYAGFARADVTDNERDSPGLGFTISYDGGEKGESTVYIYDKGLQGIPDGPMSKLVRTEFDQATRDVVELPGHRLDGRVEIVGRYGTGTPDRGQEFLCAEFVLSDVKGSRRSFVYLTGASGRFVKLRVTLRTNNATDSTARDFADAFASQLWRRKHSPTHDWVVVNEFGNSNCSVDKNSIEKRDEIARALVMYSLSPPGSDKRNDKKVSAMLNIEDYDLRAGTFQVRQTVFQYTDGTKSEPMGTVLELKPATGGNLRTLIFLKGLV